MVLEDKQRLVASHEELSVSGFGQCQQIVVTRIGRSVDLGQFLDNDSDITKAVDQPSGECRSEPRSDFRIPGDTCDFIELLGASEEIELTSAPQCVNVSRGRST